MPDFRVLRNNEPIQNLQLKYKLSTGIEVKDFPGIIPKFYEIQACHASNYQYYGNWKSLEPHEKATLIAHYYVNVLMESHKNEVITDKARKDQKKRSKGS